jgi:hypothetical protein
MRAQVVAMAIAGVVGVGSTDVQAQLHRGGASDSQARRHLPRPQRLHPASPTAAPMLRASNTLLDFDTTQRDGHMTPEERRLLRRHIEEAVRELYKR